jgi:SAM-dependent methyltransferase
VTASDAFPPGFFDRIDESDDALFYALPRFVVHIDDATIASLTQAYRELLPPSAEVLDLMSSWVSHLPEDVAFGRVAGLGMSAEELARNPRLTDYTVHDLNADPRLPYADASFDALLCAMSVQYLTLPTRVFAEASRVLRPGGRALVSLSHRCFPTKAIRAFHVISPAERPRLVAEYLVRAGGFEPPEILDRSPHGGADPLWIVSARRADTPSVPRFSPAVDEG